MSLSQQQDTPSARSGPADRFDVIIIGAGMSGMYQLYQLRKLGMSVRVFERGTGVGGTWYWNRYPGARFDSESYSYGYSFSDEILEKWDWSEHFSAQPENLRYLNCVADELDLRKDIQFNATVVACTYDEDANEGEVEFADGTRERARWSTRKAVRLIGRRLGGDPATARSPLATPAIMFPSRPAMIPVLIPFSE